MALWTRLFSKRTKRLDTLTAFSLFTADGSRGIDVRIHNDGLAYYVERQHVQGTIWKDRENRPEVGPYETPEAAEAAAIVSSWFAGELSN